MNVDGILLVDKPSGWTSFDVVAKVRGMLRTVDRLQRTADSRAPKVRVGHTGTLDPLATGLMIIVVGSYCKRASEFSKLDKTYEVTMHLGKTSTTGDAEGELTLVTSRQSSVASKEITGLLQHFTGEIMQIPPIYSAIKVGGQRAYKLARAGKSVALEPRQVMVYSLQLTEYNYPVVKFTTRVSSGTYIRSLVSDIGRSLGTGAYMSDLRRTTVGNFDIKNAIPISNLDSEKIEASIETGVVSDS